MAVANSADHFGSDFGRNSAYRCMDCYVGLSRPFELDSTRCKCTDTGFG